MAINCRGSQLTDLERVVVVLGVVDEQPVVVVLLHALARVALWKDD